MAIKIDLKKAYDRLEWSFIKDTLSLFRFPSHLIKLIMSCVSSSSISILLNGGALDPFFPSKELGKGPPLPVSLHLVYGSFESLYFREMQFKLLGSY